jgi:serine protease AprX
LTRCPLCGQPCDPQLLQQSHTLRPAIRHLVRQSNPGWRAEEGICPTCAGRYARRLAAARNAQSLHTATEPHTTFPYYHPDEETVLSQPERLPDYATIGGQGVTIAFLDSGYYPHPDLTVHPATAEPLHEWPRRNAQALQRQLQGLDSRLVHYVDLTDGGEQSGLHLPSLWDGAGYSWHGQMTTTLAAGNGALSSGHFRGYAPQAQVLPIKIGRSNGRIPEESILAGFQWLLHDDNWLRYNVRVVNVAVGGDFAEPWYNNLVCLAAEELSNRGVLICAAAGNSARETLYAPASAPSVLTVGGYEDHNRRWQPQSTKAVQRLELYHHNYGRVLGQGEWLAKPELLAIGRYLPAPILPPTPVFQELFAIAELRRVLLENRPPATPHPTEDGLVDEWLFEVWEAVRKRMNAHKWVHRFYQHVDGTSVAVAQVSAVAAQIVAANPRLTGQAVKELLLHTALPLAGKAPELSGHGLLQPRLAVATALRAHQGPLAGYPRSGVQPTAGELRKWLRQGKVTQAEFIPGGPQRGQIVYFGHFAPQAQAISLTGSWNGWQPRVQPLQPTPNGWWSGLLRLPPGEHAYRFWVEWSHGQPPAWRADPENPIGNESGYTDDHSLVVVTEKLNE